MIKQKWVYNNLSPKIRNKIYNSSQQIIMEVS